MIVLIRIILKIIIIIKTTTISKYNARDVMRYIIEHLQDRIFET